MSNDVSVLRPVFIGTVAVDIRYGSEIIQIHPTEELPNFRGELDGGYEIRTCKVDTNKGTEEIKILFSTCIEAKWLSRNSNRSTCPDVQAGERVLVWRNGDSSDFYWESLGFDRHLRQLEHYIVAISNTAHDDKNSKYLDLTNCYIFEIDTKNQKVGLYTNKNNKEPFSYTIKLDTKAGNFILRDDVGNKIFLDSTNTLIELYNIDKTTYKLNKKDIYEYCEGNHHREVLGNMTEVIHGNRTRTVKKAETITVTGKQSSKIDGGTSLKTPTYKCKSNMNSWTTPTSSFSGHVNAASIAVGGAAMSFRVIPESFSQNPMVIRQQPMVLSKSGKVGTITGDFEVIGSMSITGSVTVGATLSASGAISSSASVSAPSCHFMGGVVPPCPRAH